MTQKNHLWLKTCQPPTIIVLSYILFDNVDLSFFVDSFKYEDAVKHYQTFQGKAERSNTAFFLTEKYSC